MAYYAIRYGRLTSESIPVKDVKKFTSLTEAREYAIRTIKSKGGVVEIWYKDPAKYGTNKDFKVEWGVVEHFKGTGEFVWRIPFNRKNGNVYYMSRALYVNGKLSERFD